MGFLITQIPEMNQSESRLNATKVTIPSLKVVNAACVTRGLPIFKEEELPFNEVCYVVSVID
eukprot:gene4646-14980_t